MDFAVSFFAFPLKCMFCRFGGEKISLSGPTPCQPKRRKWIVNPPHYKFQQHDVVQLNNHWADVSKVKVGPACLRCSAKRPIRGLSQTQVISRQPIQIYIPTVQSKILTCLKRSHRRCIRSDACSPSHQFHMQPSYPSLHHKQLTGNVLPQAQGLGAKGEHAPDCITARTRGKKREDHWTRLAAWRVEIEENRNQWKESNNKSCEKGFPPPPSRRVAERVNLEESVRVCEDRSMIIIN